MQPVVRFESVRFQYPESEAPVFQNLDLELPVGVISFVGQNGTGKSTALLLASGRLTPEEGVVTIFDTPTTSLVDESERNRYASFIYQNMEFDTDAPVGELFDYVYAEGFHETKNDGFVRDLVKTFELETATSKKLQELSKGAIQRAILVFSMLYGSKSLMMDEPVFALEEYQRERTLEFLSDYSHQTGTPVYYSLHELEYSKRFADYGLLFYRDGRTPFLAPVEEAFTPERIEEAYEYPLAMLDQREYLFREQLVRLSEATD